MWKRREDEKPYMPPAPQSAPLASMNPATTRPTENRMDNFRSDIAHIGKSVVVKGELSGSEDLFVDGEVEGSIELRGNSLTIGPNGRVRANVNARDIVVQGKVDGNLRATDRVDLKKSALVTGDIITQRIAIEDGAFFKGSVDIQRQEAKPETKPVTAAAAAAASTPSAATPSATAPSTGTTGALFTPQAAVTEKK
jgi:cytoskeletal protein CcmA (bactofilin family)